MASHDPTNASPLEAKAARDLQYIRQTMERASAFTAVPGWGGIGMGVVALVAFAASQLVSGPPWFLFWLVAAPVAIVVGSWTMARKARRLKVSLVGAPGRRFAFGLVPPLLVGAILSASLWSAAQTDLLPGTWLLLYGTGVLAGGMSSVSLVPIMGVCFMVLGVVALFVPLLVSHPLLVFGFGGLHIAFGVAIVRRHGG